MATRPGVKVGNTELAQQHIVRLLIDPNKHTIKISEIWSYLMVPREDDRDVAQAKVPAMQPSYDGSLIGVYDNDSGILNASLVSFCRKALPKEDDPDRREDGIALLQLK